MTQKVLPEAHPMTSSELSNDRLDELLPESRELIDYILQYGGRCRNCADEAGICPMSGLPCDNGVKAVRHVLKAINYGVANGYLPMISRPGNFSAASEDAYYGSIWKLSNYQIGDLEKAFTRARGLTSSEVSGSQEQITPLADREKSAAPASPSAQKAVAPKPAVYIGANDVTAYVTDDMVNTVLAAFDALPKPEFGEPVLPLYLHPPLFASPQEAQGSVSEEMVEALKPFAAVADSIGRDVLFEDDYQPMGLDILPRLTDYRRARRALTAALQLPSKPLEGE